MASLKLQTKIILLTFSSIFLTTPVFSTFNDYYKVENNIDEKIDESRLEDMRMENEREIDRLQEQQQQDNQLEQNRIDQQQRSPWENNGDLEK